MGNYCCGDYPGSDDKTNSLEVSNLRRETDSVLDAAKKEAAEQLKSTGRIDESNKSIFRKNKMSYSSANGKTNESVYQSEQRKPIRGNTREKIYSEEKSA